MDDAFKIDGGLDGFGDFNILNEDPLALTPSSQEGSQSVTDAFNVSAQNQKNFQIFNNLSPAQQNAVTSVLGFDPQILIS